jgi:hypothetical protein
MRHARRHGVDRRRGHGREHAGTAHDAGERAGCEQDRGHHDRRARMRVDAGALQR